MCKNTKTSGMRRKRYDLNRYGETLIRVHVIAGSGKARNWVELSLDIRPSNEERSAAEDGDVTGDGKVGGCDFRREPLPVPTDLD
jgi:hypothetical protein